MTRPIITGTSTSGPITAAKACAGVEAKDRHRHGDGQLKVVAGGGEGQGGGLLVIRADRFAHQEADQEHDHEVDQQRDGDAHHVQRDGDDQVALEART